MAPLDDEEEASIAEGSSGQQGNVRRVSISPGMSAAPLVFHGGQRTVVPSSTRSSPRQTTDAADDYDGSYLGKSSPQPLSDEHSVEGDEIPLEARSRMRMEESLSEPVIDVQEYDPVDSIALSKRVAKELDVDDAWRKFVFGGSSDDAEAVDNRDEQRKLDLQPRNRGLLSSSMMANTSIGKSTDSRDASTILPFNPIRSSRYYKSRQASYERSGQWNSTRSQDSKSHNLAVSPGFSSIQREQNSTHAARGSLSSSISDIPRASMDTIVTSQSPVSKSITETLLRGTRTKILFSTPRPFVGRRNSKGEDFEVEEPISIGRRRFEKDNDRLTKRKERDAYSLASSEAGVEPIEDN
jgi:hypothetical protein